MTPIGWGRMRGEDLQLLTEINENKKKDHSLSFLTWEDIMFHYRKEESQGASDKEVARLGRRFWKSGLILLGGARDESDAWARSLSGGDKEEYCRIQSTYS